MEHRGAKQLIWRQWNSDHQDSAAAFQKYIRLVQITVCLWVFPTAKTWPPGISELLYRLKSTLRKNWHDRWGPAAGQTLLTKTASNTASTGGNRTHNLLDNSFRPLPCQKRVTFLGQFRATRRSTFPSLGNFFARDGTDNGLSKNKTKYFIFLNETFVQSLFLFSIIHQFGRKTRREGFPKCPGGPVPADQKLQLMKGTPMSLSRTYNLLSSSWSGVILIVPDSQLAYD